MNNKVKVLINGWPWWVDEDARLIFESEDAPLEDGNSFDNLTRQEVNQIYEYLRYNGKPMYSYD